MILKATPCQGGLRISPGHPVPRFFFHIISEVSFLDDEGTDFADSQAALIHAKELAAEMAKDRPPPDGSIVVENEDDGGLFEIPLTSWNS